MPLYNSPGGPVWVNEAYWTNTTTATATATATNTTGIVWYDAGWNLVGTGGVTSATTVISPTFWIRRGFASTVQEAVTLDRLIEPTAPPLVPLRPENMPPSQQRMVGRFPAPPISLPASPAIIREREALAQRVEQMAVADRETRARREQMEQAQTRARELLLEHLTPEQRDTFVNRGWFVVEGKRQRYRIETHRGYTGNVVAVNRHGEGIVGQRYCAHCDPGVAPGHDQFLAQKFMLEHAEDDFLRIANRH